MRRLVAVQMDLKSHPLTTKIGYGATTDGTWPYSYDSCDIGILPNQTYLNGTGPYSALHSPTDGSLSYLPGQRWSSCTCKGEDHPGPDVSVGRGVPEVDLIEAHKYLVFALITKRNHMLTFMISGFAQIVIDTSTGQVSQTLQIAPYDADWKFDNTSAVLVNTDLSSYNSYTGGVYQQSCSVLTSIPDASYEETGAEYVTFAYEMYGNKDDRDGGYITWVSDGVEAWTLKAPGLAANPLTGVGQRLIPEEPMALVINLGLSDNFQWVDKANLNFPSEMKIEYIRVYQREDFGSVGCDPAGKQT